MTNSAFTFRFRLLSVIHKGDAYFEWSVFDGFAKDADAIAKGWGDSLKCAFGTPQDESFYLNKLFVAFINTIKAKLLLSNGNCGLPGCFSESIEICIDGFGQLVTVERWVLNTTPDFQFKRTYHEKSLELALDEMTNCAAFGSRIGAALKRL